MRKTIKILAAIALIICATTLVACNPKDLSYDIVKQTKMDNFTLLNQTAKRAQIVMIGDSIVELFPTHELFAEYPKDAPLAVYNRGISGDTTHGLLARIETNALNIMPKVVSILIGTNDIGKLSQEESLQNVRAAITLARSAGIQKIVLQSIYPVNKSINSNMVGGRTNKEIKARNAMYSALAQELGCVYADVYGALCDTDGNFSADLTYDGLHPNARGYIVLAEVLKPFLAPNA